MKELLNLAIKRRSPIHLWFHMRDFGIDPSEIKKNSERIFIPFFDYVTSKQREGVLTVETMLSASRKARAFEEMCQS
jgi:hypothetical protein